MKDFRKQKKKLLMDDNKKMLPCLWSGTAESAKRGKRGWSKSVEEKNGRSSWLNGVEDKWQ